MGLQTAAPAALLLRARGDGARRDRRAPQLDKTFAQLRRDVAAAVAQWRESDIAAFSGEGTQSDRFRIDVNCEPGRTLLDDSAAALGPPGSPRGCRA